MRDSTEIEKRITKCGEILGREYEMEQDKEERDRERKRDFEGSRDQGYKTDLKRQREEAREAWKGRGGGGGMAMHDARREITGFADLLSSHSNYQPLHPASKPLWIVAFSIQPTLVPTTRPPRPVCPDRSFKCSINIQAGTHFADVTRGFLARIPLNLPRQVCHTDTAASLVFLDVVAFRSSCLHKETRR